MLAKSEKKFTTKKLNLYKGYIVRYFQLFWYPAAYELYRFICQIFLHNVQGNSLCLVSNPLIQLNYFLKLKKQ